MLIFQLGIDTDSLGIKYQPLLLDFQSHALYGFLVSVLIAMAATNPEELDLFREAKRRGEEMEVDSAATSVASEVAAKVNIELSNRHGIYRCNLFAAQCPEGPRRLPVRRVCPRRLVVCVVV